MFRWLRRRRRREVKARSFSPEWRTTIEDNLPYWALLGEEERRELEGHVLVFLEEKHFEGGGGLELTDEIRVTVAAQACLLLLGRDTDYYRGLETVLVYPSAYVAPDGGIFDGGGGDVRLGESWERGLVVLSWDSVLHGAADIHDGKNVVLHEFAHQLDQQYPASEGAPVLRSPSRYVAWARVLQKDFDGLVRAKKRHRRSVLNKYGATNPAEFFAVATEAFFEKPRQLRQKHPELYEQLQIFYGQDPAERVAQRGHSPSSKHPT